VPEYREDQPLAAADAGFGEAVAQTVEPARSGWLDWRTYNWKQISLWGVLVAGVALLAWMALRLGKQVKTGN
jgi:hypothetical protein